jgi:hypothetical protein
MINYVMIMNNKFRKMPEEAIIAYLTVPSWNFPGGIEKNTENLIMMFQ